MGDVDCDAHFGEVEAVGEPDEGQCDDVVEHEFFEVFSWFLEEEDQHDRLLHPVAGLHEVVRLEDGFVFGVWEAFEHGSRVEVP